MLCVYFLFGNKSIISHFPKQSQRAFIRKGPGTHASLHPNYKMQGGGRVIRRKYTQCGFAFEWLFSFPFDNMLKAVKSEDVQHRENKSAQSLVSVIKSHLDQE